MIVLRRTRCNSTLVTDGKKIRVTLLLCINGCRRNGVLSFLTGGDPCLLIRHRAYSQIQMVDLKQHPMVNWLRSTPVLIGLV